MTPPISPHATLAHVTLTSGHVRASPRHEVGDDTVAVLRPLLARVLAGGTVPLPYVTGGYQLRGAADGGCCALAVVGPTGEIVATIGVGGAEAGSAGLWRQLHALAPDVSPVRTRPDDPPPVPWCAARLDRGVLVHRDALAWLGDLERCLAWAYLEAIGGPRGADA